MAADTAQEPVTLAEFAAKEELQTAPVAETETAAQPVAEEAAETEPETEDTQATTTEDAATSESTEDIRSWLKDNLEFEADVYKTDEEAVKGLREKLKLATRHDEDASYGKQMRELLGGRENEIVELLQGKTETPAKAADANTDEPPPFDPAWEYQIVVDGEGNWSPAKGAPADVVSKYRNYLTWEKQQLREMARNPKQYLAKHLKTVEEQAVKRATEVIESRSQQESISRQLREWEATNLADIYANGKDISGGLTPIGQRISDLDAELAADGIVDPIRRLNRAKSIAIAEQHKVVPNGKLKKLPVKGVRQPAIAAPPTTKSKTDDELFAEGKTLVEVFKIRQQEEKAAAGEL